MDGIFDVLEFASYVRARWLTIAIACGVSLGLALAASMLLPKRYTATASLLIQAPGGNDPRASTAVSPIYLESLKSYESFASSDTLFARALNELHVREAGSKASVKSLKNHVLKISKPASTAIIEISVTLGNPKKSQAVAQFIAEQTVELSRSLDAQSSTELTREFRAQLAATLARYTSARQARDAYAAAQPVEGLQSEVESTTDLKFRLERDLEVARTELAEYTAQRSSDDSGFSARQIASEQAKIGAMESQLHGLGEILAKKAPQLDERKFRRETLESQERSAMEAWEAASARMDEVLSSAQFHGERLRIIDPGVVPDQASSPDTLLDLAAALALSLSGSIVWLAFGFSHARIIDARAERVYSLRAAR